MACVFDQMKTVIWCGHLIGMTPITHNSHPETGTCKTGFKLVSQSTVVAMVAALFNAALFVFTFIGSLGYVKLGTTGTEKFCSAVIVAALTIDWITSIIASFLSVPSFRKIIDTLNDFDSHFDRQSRGDLSRSVRLRTVFALISFVIMESIGIAAGLRSALSKTTGQYESIIFCAMQTLVFVVISVRYFQFLVVVKHIENRFRLLRTEIEKDLQVPGQQLSEKYRLLHMNLIDLFPVIDRMFPERFVSLGTALLMSACYTYKFLCVAFFHKESSVSLHLILILTNTSALLRIYATGDAGSRLTESAAESVQVVQKAQSSGLNREMQLFLLAANGRQNPSITASGFFPLSREIFCSMLNIIITYIIVLLQFQTGNGDNGASLNSGSPKTSG